ncbi:MAG: hypothetical protein AB1736_13370 [Chloroflexota bacterium]
MTGVPGRLLGGEALGDAVERLSTAVRPRGAVAGWGTVELDRAETEIGEALAAGRLDGRPDAEGAPDDGILGARCRILRSGGAQQIVLLEPSTEGPLAAALARHGEGHVAHYLLVDAGAPERARQAGFQLSAEAGGPLGRQRLVVTGPRWGPFLVLVPE